jgi:hypothetical protein
MTPQRQGLARVRSKQIGGICLPAGFVRAHGEASLGRWTFRPAGKCIDLIIA